MVPKVTVVCEAAALVMGSQPDAGSMRTTLHYSVIPCDMFLRGNSYPLHTYFSVPGQSVVQSGKEKQGNVFQLLRFYSVLNRREGSVLPSGERR